MIALKRPWPRVRTGAAFSCGGSQTWFPDENFRRCGCGVIACADTLLYLRGQELGEREAYLRYVGSLRRFFPLLPRRGIDGVRLAIGLSVCLRRCGIPVRAGWSLSEKRFWERLEAMLSDDLPAILAIGPNFPRFWGAERLTLYRNTEGGYVAAERTKAHFLTATGLDDEWLRVSSWGREFYIKRAEYARYMREHGSLFTNLLQLRRTEKQERE